MDLRFHISRVLPGVLIFASDDDVPPTPPLPLSTSTTRLCVRLAEHMAHCVERTDRPWCIAGHGATPFGVVCRCPTEVLRGRERKFRTPVSRVSFGPQEAGM